MNLKQKPRLLVALVGLLVACGDETPAPVRDVPVYPGAVSRESESRVRQRLLALLQERPGPAPHVEMYETPGSFAAVAAFYETYFRPGTSSSGTFAVAGRMRELAELARRGGSQQVAVGRLLFSRGARHDDPLPPGEIADSLTALSQRLEHVRGTIASGSIPLASVPPSEAIVTVERPHLNVETLEVDTLTVVTVVVPARPPPRP